MDTSKAESLPGVRVVLRYDDPEIEGRKLNGSVGGPDRIAGQFSGFGLKPESVILAREAWFEGQAVGAVIAADTEDIATEALRRIAGQWEELPFILDQEEAERWPVRDHEHGYQQYHKERHRRAVDVDHRPIEAVARDEQIHPDRRRDVADLHVGEKDDSHVHRVDSVAYGDR